jgi:hypothetical protein
MRVKTENMKRYILQNLKNGRIINQYTVFTGEVQ